MHKFCANCGSKNAKQQITQTSTTEIFIPSSCKYDLESYGDKWTFNSSIINVIDKCWNISDSIEITVDAIENCKNELRKSELVDYLRTEYNIYPEIKFGVLFYNGW